MGAYVSTFPVAISHVFFQAPKRSFFYVFSTAEIFRDDSNPAGEAATAVSPAVNSI
jgi:hypothetical protein